MRRIAVLTGILALVAGILGISNATAVGTPGSSLARPTSQSQPDRPPKPFYGTVTLHIKTLGLNPAVRVCGNVIYSGQASGHSRVCNQASRWVWVRRGAFVSVGLQILAPLRCKSPEPFNLPRVSQRVNITFIIDCRKAKGTTGQPGLVPVTVQVQAGACFAGQLQVRRGGSIVQVVRAPTVCPEVIILKTRLGNRVCLVVVPPFRVVNGPVCRAVQFAGQQIVFVVDGLLPPVTPTTIPVTIHLVCNPVGTPVGIVVTVHGVVVFNQPIACSTPTFIGSFPPGTVITICIGSPFGAVFLGNGPCISIVVGANQVTFNLTVIFQTTVVTTTTTVVTTTTTTTTQPPPGGGPVNPNP